MRKGCLAWILSIFTGIIGPCLLLLFDSDIKNDKVDEINCKQCINTYITYTLISFIFSIFFMFSFRTITFISFTIMIIGLILCSIIYITNLICGIIESSKGNEFKGILIIKFLR